MSLLWCNMAAGAVAMLYCFWKTHLAITNRRQLVLRRRVAYLLWVMGQHFGPGKPPSGQWRLTTRAS